MRVYIDGMEYVPKTDEFRLTDEHFEEAAKRPDSFGLIRWAHDTQSGVAEMLVWGQQIPIPENPKPVAAKPTKKPKELFS